MMKPDLRRTGRIVGFILLAQTLLAIPVYTEFGMMGSVTSPDFLTGAAAHAIKIRTVSVLTFLLSGMTIAVALVALPVFRAASERMFWLYFGLAMAGLATAAMESVVVREMLAMSINYLQAGRAEIYESLAPLARSKWSAAHFFNLASGHLKAFLFFLILYRFRFIPRLLAGIGVIATAGSTTGTTAALVGVQFSYLMIAPAGVVVLATTIWLIWKGFSEPAPLGEKSR